LFERPDTRSHRFETKAAEPPPMHLLIRTAQPTIWRSLPTSFRLRTSPPVPGVNDPGYRAGNDSRRNEQSVRNKGSGPMAKHMDGSRRNIIRATVGGISAGLMFRISRAGASDKMSRQQAEYQGSPNGLYSCGMCTLFLPPKSCKVVDGDISSDGWCKAFVLAD
jgi:hypothetical protein